MTKVQTTHHLNQAIEALNRQDTCPLHNFEVVEKDFPMRFVCSKCGAEVDGFEMFWYTKGIEHGIKLFSHFGPTGGNECVTPNENL